MVIISERVWNQSQSWHFEKVVRIEGAGTFRCRIERNAYNDQSSARVEIWSDNKWNEVVCQPIKFLDCAAISYVQSGITSRHFAKDFKALMVEAEMITKAGA